MLNIINLIMNGIIDIPRDLYLGITDGIEVTFLDTKKSRIIPFSNNKDGFSIGTKEREKKYTIIQKMVHKRKLYYLSGCSEPVKFDIKNGYETCTTPLNIKMNDELCTYYFDSKEMATSYQNKVNRTFFLTQEHQILTYMMIGIMVIITLILMHMNGMDIILTGNPEV
jgi:hypothetical protein